MLFSSIYVLPYSSISIKRFHIPPPQTKMHHMCSWTSSPQSHRNPYISICKAPLVSSTPPNFYRPPSPIAYTPRIPHPPNPMSITGSSRILFQRHFSPLLQWPIFNAGGGETFTFRTFGFYSSTVPSFSHI